MTRNRVEDHSSKEAHLLVCSSCKDAWAELNEYIRIAMAALPTTTLQVLLPVLLFCGCGLAQNSAIGTLTTPNSTGVLANFIGPLASLPTVCAAGMTAFVTDATPGLNQYFATSAGPPCVWTQQAAVNTVGGNQTASSYSTNGPGSGSSCLTAKTSGVVVCITVPDNLASGGTFYWPALGGGSASVAANPVAIYTVSTLPACSPAGKGTWYAVSDASSPTFLGALTGGSSTFTPAICNGTVWVAF
jgi:hypothetical protein